MGFHSYKGNNSSSKDDTVNTKEMLADTPFASYYKKANLGNGPVASFLLDEML